MPLTDSSPSDARSNAADALRAALRALDAMTVPVACLAAGHVQHALDLLAAEPATGRTSGMLPIR